MILRDYQLTSVDKLRAAYARGVRSLVFCLPTGGGKSLVIAHIASLAVAKGQRVLIVAGLSEILDQLIRKLQEAGLSDLRIVKADRDEGPRDARIVVASIQTLVTPKWLASPIPADFLVLDECHHGAARTWSEFIALYPDARILGNTATPQRGDQRALDQFQEIVVGATVRELTDRGYLVPAQIFAPAQTMGPRELAMDPLAAYLRYMNGQRAIVFAETVKHATAVAESFTGAGISCEWVSGVHKSRADIVDRFARGQTQVLVNVNLFVEGVDVPDISGGILARKFSSVGPFLQACGRFLRPAPGKAKATIADLRGSVLVHGTPDLEREFSLSGKGITSAREPLRQCPGCGGVYVSGAKRACIFCGHELPALERAIPRATGSELVEVDSRTKPQRAWYVPMVSKYAGICPSCGRSYQKGARIVWAKGEKAKHEECVLGAHLKRKASAA